MTILCYGCKFLMLVRDNISIETKLTEKCGLNDFRFRASCCVATAKFCDAASQGASLHSL